MATVFVLKIIGENVIMFASRDLARGAQQPQRFVGIQLAVYSVIYHLLDR